MVAPPGSPEHCPRCAAPLGAEHVVALGAVARCDACATLVGLRRDLGPVQGVELLEDGATLCLRVARGQMRASIQGREALVGAVFALPAFIGVYALGVGTLLSLLAAAATWLATALFAARFRRWLPPLTVDGAGVDPGVMGVARIPREAIVGVWPCTLERDYPDPPVNAGDPELSRRHRETMRRMIGLVMERGDGTRTVALMGVALPEQAVAAARLVRRHLGLGARPAKRDA